MRKEIKKTILINFLVSLIFQNSVLNMSLRICYFSSYHIMKNINAPLQCIGPMLFLPPKNDSTECNHGSTWGYFIDLTNIEQRNNSQSWN